MYFEQGKFELSVTTYRKLIAENADSPEAPNYQNEIINAYQKMNEKEQTLNEIQKLLKNYGKNSPRLPRTLQTLMRFAKRRTM